MNISRFIDNSSKPFHSSGYAQVANGDSIGSASVQSFGERSSIENNRQVVQRYGNSHIARGHDRTQINPNIRSSRPGSFPRERGNRTYGGAPARSSFVEPSARPYNPYQ